MLNRDNEEAGEREHCGPRNFEQVEEKNVDLTKHALKIVYPTYWLGLNLVKDVINVLIDDVTNYPDANERKYCSMHLQLINRAIQHSESTRLLTERGLYGDSFVLIRSLMSDLSMMQYLHFHPELLDLFLNEKQDDYQTNKDFKKAFSEGAIEKDLVARGIKSFISTFRTLSKMSHASSFGSQFYGSRGKGESEYHLNYGPKFQAEKAIFLIDLVISSYYDMVGNILNHRHNSKIDIDTEAWKKIKDDLRSLKSRIDIMTEATTEVVKFLTKTKHP